MLHPRHKLSYFKSQNWEPEWIQTAEDLVREQYARNYARDVESDGEPDEVNVATKVRIRKSSTELTNRSLGYNAQHI